MMRKFRASIISCIVATSLLPGCGNDAGKAPVTEIMLPDTTLTGQVTPKVAGSLSNYISIVPDTYCLDLKDSIPVLSFRVEVIQAKNGSSLASSSVDVDSTFVVLVDSLDNEVGNIQLWPDSAQLKMLNSLVSSTGVKTDLTFRGAPLSKEMKDTLAMNVVNFRLNGSFGYKISARQIDGILARWSSALSTLAGLSPHLPAVEWGTYQRAYATAHSCMNQLRSVLNLMDANQKKKYDSLRSRTPMTRRI